MPIRFATSTDIAALVRVINRAYEAEAHIFIGNRTSEADVRDRLGRPHGRFLVIDDDGMAEPGALAGAVYVETRGDRGYFGMLSVDTDRQGRGLGRELVRAAEAHCISEGCAFLDIDVVDLRTELHGFYSALGFVAVGATPFQNPSSTKMPVQLIQMTKPIA
jgi:GNAT superfamily N-acetyltransferase